MPAFPSVLKIKEAALELIQTVPPDKISVEMIRRKANVSRNTFYKHFQNISALWHTLSHDLIHSLEMQFNSLVLASTNKPIRTKRENIIRLTELSATASADYFSEFLIKNTALIRHLAIHGADPLFIEKWRNLSTSIFVETLHKSGYAMERSRRIAEPLSRGLIDGCMQGIQSNNKQAIISSYLAIGDIVYLLCEQQSQMLPRQKQYPR